MNRYARAALTGFMGAAGMLAATSAHAELTVFQTFNGSYGLSTDGGGSLGNSYGISAFVPVGATVAGAYLYQATTASGVTAITFNGSSVTFGAQSVNSSQPVLASARADVTSLVAPLINGGVGGTYNFTIGEGNTGNTEGTALVVVYSLATLPVQTVAILDGFAKTGGDVTTLNFAQPIDPTAPGFMAEMRLGISYSAGGQSSTVSVNGTQITSNAGGNEDGVEANGGLITVGGNDDAFSTLNPTYANDHERYNIAPYIGGGVSSITVNTRNPTNDDNIFLAAFVVSGNAGVNAPPPVDPISSAVPEPASWATMMMGFGLVGGMARRRRQGDRLATA